MNMNENPESTSGAAVEHMSASDSLMKAMESASSADTTEPTGDAGTVQPTTDATGQPGTQPPTEAQPQGQPKGEAPESRIQAAVRNARAEAKAEVEKQFEAFKGLDANEVRIGMELLQQLRSNPRAIAEDLIQRLGMQVGAAEEKPQVPSEFKMPEADLVSADGRLRTFSEKAVAAVIQNLTEHLTAKFSSQLKPLQDFVTTEQTARETEAETAERRQRVSQAAEAVRQMPHFDEQGVLESLRGMDPGLRRQLGPVASLHHAYNVYLRDKVFPNINTQAEAKVRDEFRRKANTSTGQVQPNGQGGPGQKPRLESAGDLAAHMSRLASAVAE